MTEEATKSSGHIKIQAIWYNTKKHWVIIAHRKGIISTPNTDLEVFPRPYQIFLHVISPQTAWYRIKYWRLPDVITLMTKNIRIERKSGTALLPYIPELARLRIEVFRDFPYLYDGTLDYEKKYLQTYIDHPESVIVLAFDGDRIVGASTAIPMKYETDELKKPFLDNGYNLDEVFYCSESVLNKAYRGLGLGVRFFEGREAHAEELGGFKHITFCCVERPIDHPRRPSNYMPLDKFWNKRGYFKHPELKTTYFWKDLDDEDETAKPMTFWLKHDR